MGSSLQECGFQQWWDQKATPEYMNRTEELSSVQVTVKFYANLTERHYRNVEEALRSFGHSVSRDGQTANVIHVTGYDAPELEGHRVLDVFQRYDRHARRIAPRG